MTEQDVQLITALAQKEEATEHFIVGVPGVVVAALVAPDCVMFRDERFGYPIMFCLN